VSEPHAIPPQQQARPEAGTRWNDQLLRRHETAGTAKRARGRKQREEWVCQSSRLVAMWLACSHVRVCVDSTCLGLLYHGARSARCACIRAPIDMSKDERLVLGGAGPPQQQHHQVWTRSTRNQPPSHGRKSHMSCCYGTGMTMDMPVCRDSTLTEHNTHTRCKCSCKMPKALSRGGGGGDSSCSSAKERIPSYQRQSIRT
jgi:hypothetical protein